MDASVYIWIINDAGSALAHADLNRCTLLWLFHALIIHPQGRTNASQGTVGAGTVGKSAPSLLPPHKGGGKTRPDTRSVPLPFISFHLRLARNTRRLRVWNGRPRWCEKGGKKHVNRVPPPGASLLAAAAAVWREVNNLLFPHVAPGQCVWFV